jgi:signal transduction histidine kinase
MVYGSRSNSRRQHFWFQPWHLLLFLLSLGLGSHATAAPASDVRKILIIFSEGKDLPGNVLLEQAVRSQLQKQSTNTDEFYTEHMDASHFSDETHYQIFRDYLAAKYAGQELDLAIVVMARDFALAQRLSADIFPSLPMVFVTSSELDPPETVARGKIPGIIQRLDVEHTLKLIGQLKPETRKVVVIGGVSPADRKLLERIAATEPSLPGVRFEYWTNQPMEEIGEQVKLLPPGTAILISSIFEDISGHTIYMAQAAQKLARSASAPIYVLSSGALGSGAVGGAVVDTESLGRRVAELGFRAMGTKRASRSGIELRTDSILAVDWRALERWSIPSSRVPPNAAVRFRPTSIWQDHRPLVLATLAVLLAQGLTIAGLVAQHSRRRRAEAEILRQRGELAHVSRVSTMGQLASSLAHEINQPLGAILRNTEAAEMFLKNGNPDYLGEVRAILVDIRKDDQRAGEVIDRMRSLLKRRNLELTLLDLNQLLEETFTLVRADAQGRKVRLSLSPATGLPLVRGDRVQLQQVFLNLVINGMDAMNECANGDRLLSVTVKRSDSNDVEVAVSDRGTGIPPDKLAQVFDPFFTTKTEGMGMGLAISRTIVEAHGGKIRARNNDSCGATIQFSLPLSNN